MNFPHGTNSITRWKRRGARLLGYTIVAAIIAFCLLVLFLFYYLLTGISNSRAEGYDGYKLRAKSPW